MTRENCMTFRRGVCNEAWWCTRTRPLPVWLATGQPATPGRGARSVPRPPLEALGRGSPRRAGSAQPDGPGALDVAGNAGTSVAEGWRGQDLGSGPPGLEISRVRPRVGNPVMGGSDGSFWVKTLGPARTLCLGDLVAIEATGKCQRSQGRPEDRAAGSGGTPQSREGLRIQR